MPVGGSGFGGLNRPFNTVFVYTFSDDMKFIPRLGRSLLKKIDRREFELVTVLQKTFNLFAKWPDQLALY